MPQKKKIILVDDDPYILDCLNELLAEEGYDMSSFHSGKHINLSKNIPDLFLLDLWMSGENGYMICKQLKENPATKKIPVMLLSASAEVAHLARKAGADAYLIKPFEMRSFLSKVKRLLSVSKQRGKLTSQEFAK